MTHGDRQATIDRLLAMDDHVFSDLVKCEARGRAGDDIVHALRDDADLCQRWLDALVVLADDVRARQRALEGRDHSLSHLRRKVDQRIVSAKAARARLTVEGLKVVIGDMERLLDTFAGPVAWLDEMDEHAYELYERLVLPD